MHTCYSLFFHYFQDTALVVMICETGSDQEFSCGGRAGSLGLHNQWVCLQNVAVEDCVLILIISRS